VLGEGFDELQRPDGARDVVVEVDGQRVGGHGSSWESRLRRRAKLAGDLHHPDVSRLERAHRHPRLEDAVHAAGEPRPVAELLAAICRAAGVRPPQRAVPSTVALVASSVSGVPWSFTGHFADIAANNLLREKSESAAFAKVAPRGMMTRVDCPCGFCPHAASTKHPAANAARNSVRNIEGVLQENRCGEGVDITLPAAR